jgi:hypothetical protein
MKFNRLMKRMLVVLIANLLLLSCKKCQTCSNLCYECVYYSDNRVEVYCSDEYQRFIDLEAYVGQVLSDGEASCDIAPSSHQIKVCDKETQQEYISNNFICN